MVHTTIVDAEQFKNMYELDPYEWGSMMELFKAKPQHSKLKIDSGIKIYDAHSLWRALQWQVVPSVTVPFLIALFLGKLLELF